MQIVETQRPMWYQKGKRRPAKLDNPAKGFDGFHALFAAAWPVDLSYG